MKRNLVLYLASASDTQRFAVGPTLAALCDRRGWGFDCYYSDLRRGRHFGGGDPAEARQGWPAGSLPIGGGHAESLLWLATTFNIVAVGDPGSPLFPVVEAVGGQTLERSSVPSTIYASIFEFAGEEFPRTIALVDGAPQGPRGIVIAPYLFPAFFGEERVIGLETSSAYDELDKLRGLGAERTVAWYVDQERIRPVSEQIDQTVGSVRDFDYADLTAELAREHATWGEGILVGDPALVAAQLPRAVRRRLIPLYGMPQKDVFQRVEGMLKASDSPAFGRQFDDRDFFDLADSGLGLQVIDPTPPFAGMEDVPFTPTSIASKIPEPTEDELAEWAREGKVLTTLIFWTGMVREIECLGRICDLIGTTGLKAGAVMTSETMTHTPPSTLSILTTPSEKGGTYGLLEPILGSTGDGVAAEYMLPPGRLRWLLQRAIGRWVDRVGEDLRPRGWWPLMDSPLVRYRTPPVGRAGLKPVFYFTPRYLSRGSDAPTVPGQSPRDLRSAVGRVVRRLHLDRLMEERRPFDAFRSGDIDQRVAEEVAEAGLDFMWSKADFGKPRVAYRSGDFVGLSLTMGNWDGWSPFYTVSTRADVRRGERRALVRKKPGWLVGTVDSPLWLLSGEVLEHGSRIYDVASYLAGGGSSGRLVNATPTTIARYARFLDNHRLLM